MKVKAIKKNKEPLTDIGILTDLRNSLYRKWKKDADPTTLMQLLRTIRLLTIPSLKPNGENEDLFWQYINQIREEELSTQDKININESSTPEKKECPSSGASLASGPALTIPNSPEKQSPPEKKRPSSNLWKMINAIRAEELKDYKLIYNSKSPNSSEISET